MHGTMSAVLQYLSAQVLVSNTHECNRSGLSIASVSMATNNGPMASIIAISMHNLFHLIFDSPKSTTSSKSYT